MVYSQIEAKTHELALPVVEGEGYEIYDVVYIKEGPDWFLRLFIERNGGVSLDDCERISRLVSAELDAADFIKGNYFFEVSSPGLERALRQPQHFEQAAGKKISVVLKNGKRHEGIVTENTNNSLTLEAETVVDKKNIKKANIVFEFEF